jgi:hypothetical protein
VRKAIEARRIARRNVRWVDKVWFSGDKPNLSFGL